MSNPKKKNKEKKEISRRTFLLSGLMAALGGYLGYTNREKISDWARWPYTRFFDERPNIIMIAMDTLRADRLGCYGYDRNITPNIDAFAKESMLYWNTMSQSNWTLPAFASLFTSLYPHNHATGIGIDEDRKAILSSLPSDLTTLADILCSKGYHTAAFTGGYYVSKIAGLNKGFREFYQISRDLIAKPNDLPWQLDNASKWIKENSKYRKFFLFVHSYECHGPYVAPKKYVDLIDPDYDGPPLTGDLRKDLRVGKEFRTPTEVELKRFNTFYDAEILYSDTLLGDFFSLLKDLKIYDNSLIIFLSDHGEEFYDHKGWEHRHTMYEEMLRVPVIVKYPEGRETGVDKNRLVRLIDIMPTILHDFLDIPNEQLNIDGKPLSQPLDDDNISLSESRMTYEGINIFGFRNKNKKYMIRKKGNEIKYKAYNLENDPLELNNLAKKHKLDMEGLWVSAREAELVYLKNMKELNHPVEVDNDTIKMLKDLGYVD